MSIDIPSELKIIGLLMMVIGSGWLVTDKGAAIWKWFRKRTTSTVNDAGHNSDQQPPDGFVEHVGIIHAAAPNCPPDIREGYCLAGKTEAQVLLAERIRLDVQDAGSA